MTAWEERGGGVTRMGLCVGIVACVWLQAVRYAQAQRSNTPEQTLASRKSWG